MDRNAAEKLLEILALLEVPCGRLDGLLSDLNEDELEKYRSLVGDLLHVHFALVMPVIGQFPDLDPDGAGKESYQKLREKYARAIP